MKEILEQSNLRLPSGWRMVLWALVVLGILTFIGGLAMGSAERTWEALLINTIFFGGMAQAGVMLSVIWQITDAKWGRPFKRIAEGFGAFLPVAFLMFMLVFFGGEYLYEWVEHPMTAKAGYLNMGFFVSRNLVALLVMYGISFFFLMASLKPDLALARQLVPGWGGNFADRVLRGYGDPEEEQARLALLSRRLAPL
ncbi:MAG: molybdopterin oxidoreductase, partial [Proteobacteria bacterium]|nr:molybdopterin oxidoreductase [Pseudomonadota bacterium]